MGRGLYNGNISSMLVNIPKLGDAQLYGYSYDQLNRLTAMNAYTGLSTGNNSFVPVGSTNYKERVSYDGNGNILSYLRNRAGVGVDTSMDKLSYTYAYDGDGFLVKNRLKQVSDAVVSTPAGTGDLPTGQVSDNYGYDAIGNLVKDESEGIASGGIEWNVYGKISQITKTNGGVTTVIKYTYDATGNRIGKWVQVGAGTPKQTAYVRDASGNVMAIYEKGNSEVNGGLLSQIEVPLYGSSRLGVWRPDREVETTGWELFDTDPMTGTGGGIAGGWERGRVQFELSNHLGNVLVTISDVRIPVLMPEGIELCDDPVHPACYRPIDYYLPQVLTANDYYPFGMGMPGRKYSEGNYRYGFNGKEKDSDINSLTAYDYGFRIYNPAIGKFLSVDPLTQSYPWYTPYQFAGNKPIWYIDLDGLEEALNERSIRPVLTNVSESTCVGCAERVKGLGMSEWSAKQEKLKKEYEVWRSDLTNIGKPLPPQFEHLVGKSSARITTIQQGGYLASKEYVVTKANYETFGKFLPGISDIDDGLTFIGNLKNGEYKAAAFTALFFLPGGDFLKPLKKLKGAGKLGGNACIDFAKDFMAKYARKIEEAGGTVNKMEIRMGSGNIGVGIGAETKRLSETGLHQFVEVSDASGTIKIFDNAHHEGILKSDYLKNLAGSNTTDGFLDGAQLYEKYAKKIK